uniref:Transposase n=1 Tax=Acrobeloides nanus TaxID=290746 RepID=A0A914EEN4_9BILA
MPLMSRRVYDRYKHHWVDPAISEMYEDQKERAIEAAPKPLRIASDGQYDSRGYSAEMCCVLAMDEVTKRILTFAVVDKSEVGGVSNRMEKFGTQRVVEELQGRNLEISGVTIDKHAAVMKYFKDIGIVFNLDAWHLLGKLSSSIRAEVKSLKKQPEQQGILRDLGR